MDSGLLVICTLTFVIHLIGTLAYSVRIAGSRTYRLVAVALQHPCAGWIVAIAERL